MADVLSSKIIQSGRDAARGAGNASTNFIKRYVGSSAAKHIHP